MDHNALLDLMTDLGHELAMSGAETFRVEESIRRIAQAYSLEAEVFAIPNCITVSIETPEGKPMTRMRRIGIHGNDLDAVDRFSGLSRRICSLRPSPAEAKGWLKQVRSEKRRFPLWIGLLGHGLAAGGFSLLFGGDMLDGLCGALCGLVIGLIDRSMDRLRPNQFFRILAAAFPMAFLAYTLEGLGIASNADIATIGALMLLVPGLLFTNAMRDIIFGDTNSGTNRIVQVLLISAALTLGTAAAWNTAQALWTMPASPDVPMAGPVTGIIPSLIGCLGFCIVFNIHGRGALLCALGGVLSWVVYSLILRLGGSDAAAFFWGTVCGAVYSELMARLRRRPAISYLVIAIFPLLPGAGLYYTMRYALQGDMALFVEKGMRTAAEAGIMAVAILLVSTMVRIQTTRRPPR